MDRACGSRYARVKTACCLRTRPGWPGWLTNCSKGFRYDAGAFERLRANLVGQPAMRWEEGWKAEAAAVFAQNQMSG